MRGWSGRWCGGPVIGPPANHCGVEDGGEGEQEDQSSGAEPEEGRLGEVQAADGGEDRSGAGGGEHGLEAEKLTRIIKETSG